MRARSLLIVVTALLSSILGAVAVYLVLTVPNDVQASALLKQARHDIALGNNEQARQSLTKVIQQYPRTDAAAAAIVALSSVETRERQALVARIDTLQRANDEQTRQLQSLGVKVQQATAAPPPPPAPAPVTISAPPPSKKKTTHTAPRTTQRTKRRAHRR